jgi:enamine deaminase RidA (YjgF/YER057c/UK114 family)
MRTMLYPAFGHEFITVSGESRPGLPPDEAARDLFARFSTELQAHGLSLDDTVRTRLWGRDRAARDGGSGERVRVLSGKARSASSSYISPRHFDSAGAVAVDLWAMRGAAQKTVQEYDPPIVPPRYIVTGGLVFLSGVTWDTGTLDEQLDAILPRLDGSLQDAGASWAHVVKLSCFLPPVPDGAGPADGPPAGPGGRAWDAARWGGPYGGRVQLRRRLLDSRQTDRDRNDGGALKSWLCHTPS